MYGLKFIFFHLVILYYHINSFSCLFILVNDITCFQLTRSTFSRTTTDMASVDGSKSLQAASDELFDHVCVPCENEGIVKEAKQYCGVCSEFLCDACVRHHRKLTLTKCHKIVQAHIVSVSSLRRLSINCGCNNNKETEYYCENHSDVICSPCKDVKHHKCRTIPIQQKCSGYKSSKIDAILAKAKSLKEKYDRLKQNCSKNKKELVRSKDVCQKEIKAFRKELNDFLDTLEQKMLTELEKREEENRKKIDQQITTLSNALQMLDTENMMLGKAKVDGRNQVMFAAEVQAAKTIRDCESRLADLEKEVAEVRLSFEKNKKLADLQADVKSLGAIDKETKKVEQDDKIVLLGKHVQSHIEVDAKLDDDDDDDDPWITGCAVIPNGNIVICDRNNDRLKLFANSWVRQESLTILDIWRVSVVDPNTVIVTVEGQKKLQYVQILPQLQLGRTIQLDSKCYGVCVSGDDIYVTCKTSNGSEIRVFSLDGTLKRRVPTDKNSSPYEITLSPSGEKIFYTDSKTESVTCMTVDGRIVYQYRDDNLKCATGMYCDSEDNLFVCDFESDNVQAISADGKSCGTLLISSDGLVRPSYIAYRSSDNELIIGCDDLDHLLVYKMSN